MEIIGYRFIRNRATGEIVGPLVPVFADEWPYRIPADSQTVWRYMDLWKFEAMPPPEKRNPQPVGSPRSLHSPLVSGCIRGLPTRSFFPMVIDHSGQLRDEIFAWLSRHLPERGAQAVDGLPAAIGTSISTTRAENQDCAVVLHYVGGPTTPPLTSLILCDGIGGMRDGGVCARLAAATFAASLLGRKFEKAAQRILRAAHAANDKIFTVYHEHGGTTLSSIVIQDDNDCAAINVGDSRIYRIASDRLTQLTTDDTLANQIQHLRPDQPTHANPAFGKQLTQFIGMGRDVQFRLVDLGSDSFDRTGFLLTSDGIHHLNQDSLRDVTLCAPSSLEVVKRLTTLAKWGKSTDDATVISIGKPLRPDAAPTKSSNQLAIWDSHSSLHVLLDAASWGKEKRAKAPKRRPRHNRPDESRTESRHPDSHPGTTTAPSHGKSDKREPLQMEILGKPDEKAAD